MNAKSQVASQFLGNGRFKLVEKIGEGAIAVVYLVEDTHLLSVRRAMKVLKPNMAKSREMRRRFLDEARAMALVENPGIVRIYDCGEEIDGKIWILMELIEGCSLAERLVVEPLHPRLAVEVAIAVLAALVIAHQKGIVHRDIKPQNVMLTNRGEIKVTDFGIARFNTRDSLTKTGIFMGTEGFVSPEQQANSKDVDARADIYSVAALLYCCLTVGEAMPVLFAADLDAKIMANIPEPLSVVIKKATRYKREERYASAEEMIAALEEVKDALPALSDETLPLAIPKKEEAEGDKEFDGSAMTLVPENTAEFSLPSEDLGEVGGGGKTSLPFDQETGQKSRFKFGGTKTTIVVVVTLSLFVWWLVGFEKKMPEPIVVPQPVEPILVEVPANSSLADEAKPSVDSVKAVEDLPPVSAVAPKIPKSRVVKSMPIKEEAVIATASAVTAVEIPPVEVAVANETPKLAHDTPAVWPVGQPFTPEVKISGGEYRVRIYFRLSGTMAYTNFAMTEKDGVWRANIPVEVGATGFDYHISAEPKEEGLPKLSSGSGFKPHTVRVE